MKIGDTITKKEYTEAALWCQNNHATIKLNGQGEYQIIEVFSMPNKQYIKKRLEEYPTLSEQLDMIYWDKVNGSNLWQEKIAEIKAKSKSI